MKRITTQEINRLAIPAIISGVIEPVISLTDTVMAGNIADNTKEILGAVGVVISFLSALLWIFLQASRALTSQVAYAYGQGRITQVKGLVAQILLLSLIVSLSASVISYMGSEFILNYFYDIEGNLLDFSLDYFRIRVWGFPFTLLTLTIYSVFRGFQNTSWAMYISLTGGIINVVFNYIFVYIFHWGIKGLAWASLLSQGVMFVLSVVVMYSRTPFKFLIVRGLHPKFVQSLRMSADLLIRSSLLQAVLYFSFAKAALLGTEGDNTAVATHTLLNQVWSFSTFLFDGYCNAGGLLSGRLYGIGQYQAIRNLVKQLFYIVLAIGIGILIVYFIFYYWIGTILTQDIDILPLFYDNFWIVVLMQPITAIAFLFDGIYKGMGLTKQLRNTFIIATLLGFFPAYYITQNLLDWGLSGIWIAFYVWMVFRGGILFLHYLSYFFGGAMRPSW